MREELVTYYTMKVFHEWFTQIAQRIGDSPFQAVVQNFIYYPDSEDPTKSRLEVFVNNLKKFIDETRKIDDTNIKLKSFEVKGVNIDQGTSQPTLDDYVGDPGNRGEQG